MKDFISSGVISIPSSYMQIDVFQMYFRNICHRKLNCCCCVFVFVFFCGRLCTAFYFLHFLALSGLQQKL